MSSLTTALILAGGENSRFFPFNSSTHKGALPLFGTPLIVQTLRQLEAFGFTKAVIVVSPKDMHHSNLKAIVQDQALSIELIWVLQPEAKGMGNATLLAAEHLPGKFLITFPHQIDIAQVLQLLSDRSEPELLFTSETDHPWLYGILSVEHGKAVGIVEKPEPGTEPSRSKVEGVYVLSERFIKILNDTPESEYAFEAALDTLMQDAPIATVRLQDELLTQKFPWHLFGLQHHFFATTQRQHSADAKIASTAILDDSLGPIMIEAGATLGDFAKIVGPAYIGRNALVGEYSFIRQSSIEESAVVGAKTELVRSIVFPRATMHQGYVADSIIGSDVNIGGGVMTANKRLDRANIQIPVKGKKIDIGKNSCGVFIGDRAKLGVRTTTMPGTLIGADAVIYPGLTLRKPVAHGEVVTE